MRELALRAYDGDELSPKLQAVLAATYAAGLRDGAGVRVGRREMMTPAEVLALLPVDRKTVKRWADRGLLRVTRTAGGHRRYLREDVAALLVKHGWVPR
ncbi:helix-turn-helix domain-containing protein [Catellatospora bangladeshensis]|uniref:helix-turn-helix domain-containing protein n=1 Tax=Catellatospora bangladeshensis TaxID=310355 RepID=UPI00361D0B00